MTVKPGAAGTVQIVNTGSKAITVSDSLGRYSSPAIRYPAADHATLTTMEGPWLTVTPSHFTLAPGHAETVHISSHVPAGAAGDHFLSLLWAMRPVHAQAGAVHAAGGVATLVTIPLPGTATPVTSATAPPPAPHYRAAGHGLDSITMAGIGMVAFAALTVVAVIVAMRRRAGRREAWHARRRDGLGQIHADSPHALVVGIRIDYSTNPVPRPAEPKD
jgi:hypothetical protein